MNGVVRHRTIHLVIYLDQQLRHTAFFEHLDEFGYFSELTELLPENFTSVFEIARVLEDENSELFRILEPALTVTSAAPRVEQKSRSWQPNRHLPVQDEFDVDFIQSVSEVNRLLPSQFVLPDEVFLRRLARRELMRRVARHPIIVPFGNSSNDYAPNYFKQKVYVLLDTSASMSSHHRFQMAKAVVYIFLKRNLKELGHIYFRTFDRVVSPLVKATDTGTLKRLIRHVMRLRHLGNGTALEKAILTACEDIRDEADLSGAELLVITDGAAHLDRVRILEALGNAITINAIKIGDASVAIDEKILQDEAARGHSPESHALAKVEERIRHLNVEVLNASHARTERIRGELASLESQAARMRTHIVEHMRVEYGREIEGLARVFVNIHDISADSIFQLSQLQIEELRELVQSAEELLREGFDSETLKEIALLYEHVSMLLDEKVDENRADLLDIQKRLGEMLDNFATSVGKSLGGSARSISRDDLKDLGFMMQHRSLQDDSIFSKIIDMIRRLLKLRPVAGIRQKRSR